MLAPSAVWIATSMDAVFLAAGAWGTALLALAARRARTRTGTRTGVWAGAGAGAAATAGAAGAAGLLLGCLPYLSYGLLPLFAVPLAVLLPARPGPAVLGALAAGLAAVPAAFTLLGFWWPDGVAATLDTYLVSRGSAQRSYAYFALANLAVLGLLTGPATARALPRAARALHRAARTRTRAPAAAVAALAAAALAGVLALDASGVTKGEVERIWVPFAGWAVAAAALHRPPARGWLAAQAATALAVQALVLSPW
ncbi:integral membrane protein [Mycobacterium tuberculosis]|nr:integral membrane protein [Mycobacterium tuberculosis]